MRSKSNLSRLWLAELPPRIIMSLAFPLGIGAGIGTGYYEVLPIAYAIPLVSLVFGCVFTVGWFWFLSVHKKVLREGGVYVQDRRWDTLLKSSRNRQPRPRLTDFLREYAHWLYCGYRWRTLAVIYQECQRCGWRFPVR